MDDIADSFDYKNKYAIVEYLYEISQDDNFKMIILSHNFDFYRTVSERLNLHRKNRLFVNCKNGTIEISEEKYQNKPFIFWRNNLNYTNMLALIPFVRNIIEYQVLDCNENDDYKTLTNLLHQKEKSELITFEALKDIYSKYFDVVKIKKEFNQKENVLKKLYEIADNIGYGNNELEHKIILAMDIRHNAESYMKKKIGEYGGELSWQYVKNGDIETGISEKFLSGLYKCYNQTRVLSNVMKQFSSKDVIKVIDEVNIMTPENIHLNSFMYEPLLDMDINELLTLRNKINKLK